MSRQAGRLRSSATFTTMPTLHDPHARRLLRFNAAVLNQASSLVAAHQTPGAPDYAYPVGAHLRHVIEHYEALILPSEPGAVDYDQRPRDRELATRTSVARARLRLLLRRLAEWTEASLEAPLQVRGLGGLAGDFHFAVHSSIGRELVFVASHAIHHYALLQPSEIVCLPAQFLEPLLVPLVLLA